jgi:3'-phosphoadenosine 5'-phosphosulfate sulfotransferase (PAPS reductase)/FAD synthetase
MSTKQTLMLSLGAGVQSTTLALLAVHGEIEKPEHAIFADTGWESNEVYEHLEWLKPIMQNAGIKVHKVTAGNIRKDTLSPGRFASMPFHMKDDNGKRGMAIRQCTQEYKLAPILKKQRELVGIGYRQRWKPEHGQIVNQMGISVDEIQRAKDNPAKYITNVFPLLDLRMKRSDCIAWLNDHGYSAPRSACIGCPYHSDHEWRKIKENPTEWADAVQFDKQIRKLENNSYQSKIYLHKSCQPLDEVDFSTEEERGQFTLFDNECEGMCGL